MAVSGEGGSVLTLSATRLDAQPLTPAPDLKFGAGGLRWLLTARSVCPVAARWPVTSGALAASSDARPRLAPRASRRLQPPPSLCRLLQSSHPREVNPRAPGALDVGRWE